MSKPEEVQLSLADFDRSQLPPAQRDLTGDAFREAVREHLSGQFAGTSGAAEVVITDDRIIIRWMDATEGKSLTEHGVEQFKTGEMEKGVSTLRVALQRNPGDREALFNLGVALSEQGELEEAVTRRSPSRSPCSAAADST